MHRGAQVLVAVMSQPPGGSLVEVDTLEVLPSVLVGCVLVLVGVVEEGAELGTRGILGQEHTLVPMVVVREGVARQRDGLPGVLLVHDLGALLDALLRTAIEVLLELPTEAAVLLLAIDLGARNHDALRRV